MYEFQWTMKIAPFIFLGVGVYKKFPDFPKNFFMTQYPKSKMGVSFLLSYFLLLFYIYLYYILYIIYNYIII